MSFVIYRCHSSFINVAYVLYFGTNGAPYKNVLFGLIWTCASSYYRTKLLSFLLNSWRHTWTIKQENHLKKSAVNNTIRELVDSLCRMWDFFRSRTNRITTRFKLVSNVSVTIQWPSSVHCIVTETFDTNLNLIVVRLVWEQKKSHMDIPGLYKC